MDRHKIISELESTFGVALGVVASQQASHWLKAILPSAGAKVMFTILVITACIFLVKLAITWLFAHSRFIRRLFMGRQYIEGTWFDIMRKNGEIAEIGFSHISYNRSSIKFYGEDYDLALDQCFPYRAEITQLKWPCLCYVYSASRADNEQAKTTGYGLLDFQEQRHGYPRKYTGKYFVLRGTETICFEGVRLDDKKDAALIAKLGEPKFRKEALYSLLNQYA